MKSLQLKIIILFFLGVTNASFSQNFSIDGISGITFNESGTDYSINITDDFNAYGVGISPQSVTLQYTTADNSFDITGNVVTTIDGNTINSEFTFKIKDKAVQQISFNVTTDFVIEGLTFQPNSLTFQWDISESRFEIFGDASIDVDSNTIDIELGNDANPGFIINNGSISQIQASIFSDFSLKDIGFEVTSMGLNYSSANKTFAIYGQGSVQFDGEQVDIVLGKSHTPGFIFD